MQIAGFVVCSFQNVVGPDGSVGKIDIETSCAIIETAFSAVGKLGQIRKELSSSQLNPTGKPVILFAPNYGDFASQAIIEAGGHVVRDMGELITLLNELGEI